MGELSLCDPIKKNKDLKATHSINNTPLDPEGAANPCGLIANSFFNGMIAFD